MSGMHQPPGRVAAAHVSLVSAHPSCFGRTLTASTRPMPSPGRRLARLRRAAYDKTPCQLPPDLGACQRALATLSAMATWSWCAPAGEESTTLAIAACAKAQRTNRLRDVRRQVHTTAVAMHARPCAQTGRAPRRAPVGDVYTELSRTFLGSSPSPRPRMPTQFRSSKHWIRRVTVESSAARTAWRGS